MSECNEIMNLRHEVSDLRRRVENMAVALTDNGLNDISLRVALAVEDQFAMSHPGGRTQRLAKIQLLVRHAVVLATRGQDRWDDKLSKHPLRPAPKKG